LDVDLHALLDGLEIGAVFVLHFFLLLLSFLLEILEHMCFNYY
jgi:hypothetical protein